MNYIVFTDLDGTLLDHYTYSYEGAKTCLEYIKSHNIPLVFVTSKTRVEVEKLIKEISYDISFSVENGAAVFFYNNYKKCNKVFGRPIDEIINFYNSIKERFGLVNIYEIDEKELSKIVNLPLDKIKYLKMREYSLPFLIKEGKLFDHLKETVQNAGFKLLKGGRFYHFVGKDQDKGVAVRHIRSILGRNRKAIGLGDSENDYDLLKNVDIPIIIRKYNNTYDEKLSTISNAVKTEQIGPLGWCEAFEKILAGGEDG
jgi:mannosyl-3-phosphoglycerate phosphatase